MILMLFYDLHCGKYIESVVNTPLDVLEINLVAEFFVQFEDFSRDLRAGGHGTVPDTLEDRPAEEDELLLLLFFFWGADVGVLWLWGQYFFRLHLHILFFRRLLLNLRLLDRRLFVTFFLNLLDLYVLTIFLRQIDICAWRFGGIYRLQGGSAAVRIVLFLTFLIEINLGNLLHKFLW